MNNIGERLREERERLGLTQAEFGEIGGVKKLAQFNYEKNERRPSASYFDNLRTNQLIDVGYILNGWRDNDQRRQYMAESLVNALISIGLDIDPEAFSPAIDKAYDIDAAGTAEDESIDPVISLVEMAISDSPRVIDFELLKSIITDFETTLNRLELSVIPERKADAITMLYRSFKQSKKVNQNILADAIKLAVNNS